MTQNLQLHKISPWADLVQRFRWAIQAFQAPRLQPQIEMGGGVVFDLEKRTLILPPDYRIEAQGNLSIGAQEHLMFFSGRDPESRDGYLNSIWFNPELDHEGRPLKDDDTPGIVDGEVLECKEHKHD